MRRLLPLLLVGAAATADETLAAKDIFQKAVRAQGKLQPEDVKDVTLTFSGEVHDQGEVHTIERTYRFRADDRSFRVHTGSGAVDRSTDRGVLGADGYWERTSKGRILALSRTNRDDNESIRQIETERGEFERMLRMVLLTRLEEGWEVVLGAPAPVRLDGDEPRAAKATLGDKEKETYHVLDAARDGEPKMRLYVSAADFTVRKAIEYVKDDASRVERVYYFAGYRRDDKLDLLLPRYFSVYRDTPTDEATRDKLWMAWGEPKVLLNTDLKDPDLRPAP